jgi:hypothetical protein
MLNPNEPQGSQDQDEQEFGNSDWPTHDEDSPVWEHFNELLSIMSTKTMVSLLTAQQKNLALALWEACNYGGKPLPGNLRDMEDKRLYYEWVLRMEHRRQWKNSKKFAKL